MLGNKSLVLMQESRGFWVPNRHSDNVIAPYFFVAVTFAGLSMLLIFSHGNVKFW